MRTSDEAGPLAVDDIICMARISVLRRAANLGQLGYDSAAQSLIDRGLVVVARPEAPGEPFRGAYGVLSLTHLARVLLRVETARWAGRRLPMSERQLSLFVEATQ